MERGRAARTRVGRGPQRRPRSPSRLQASWIAQRIATAHSSTPAQPPRRLVPPALLQITFLATASDSPSHRCDERCSPLDTSSDEADPPSLHLQRVRAPVRPSPTSIPLVPCSSPSAIRGADRTGCETDPGRRGQDGGGIRRGCEAEQTDGDAEECTERSRGGRGGAFAAAWVVRRPRTSSSKCSCITSPAVPCAIVSA